MERAKRLSESSPEKQASQLPQTATGSGPNSATPRVWLLVGEKRGDNGQIESLARAVGWPFESKKILMQPQWREGKPRVRPSLDHIDLTRSDSVASPWPDLIITAGRRLSSVALYVKEASGGKTRIVLIGQPRRGAAAEFDLAVVAAHYTLPAGPNVARHDLPLMHVDSEVLEAARLTWGPRLEPMPRPLTALMVGGRTGGLRFDQPTAERLLAGTLDRVAAHGGSLFVTTSRRTPPEVVRLFERNLPGDASLYVFDPDSGPGENPYHGLLACADDFVVTTDSASMMVEVARLGRSMALFALESEVGPLETWAARLGILRKLSPQRDPLPAGGAWARTMDRLGWPRHSRDLSAIPRLLVARGGATWIGGPAGRGETSGSEGDAVCGTGITPAGPYEDDALQEVAARIRGLFQ